MQLFIKPNLRMLLSLRNRQVYACSVIDCRRCWLRFCAVLRYISMYVLHERTIIDFNSGLPLCIKYMALGPPVTTEIAGFAFGFCGVGGLLRRWISVVLPRAQEYNSPRFRRCDECCAFGIAILLYIDKGVPVLSAGSSNPAGSSATQLFATCLAWGSQ